MSPASGPVENAKMFPAATLEDQEAIMNDEHGEPIVLGAPPYSSPDPATDGRRMLPLEDGTSAHNAALQAEAARTTGGDYKSMKVGDLKSLAEERGLTVERGDGGEGNPTKADYEAALTQDDTADMKASDWKAQVEGAADQGALDEIAERYDNSGAEYSSVVAAIEKKQAELDGEDES